MVDPIQIHTGATNVGSATGPSQGAGAKSSAASGMAFRALLDQLADRAKALEATSEKPVDARDLAGAVEQAHGSLQDALQLSAQLLEAYRANLQNQDSTSIPNGTERS